MMIPRKRVIYLINIGADIAKLDKRHHFHFNITVGNILLDVEICAIAHFTFFFIVSTPRNHVPLQEGLMKQNGGARSPSSLQDRRSLLLLIALIDLTRAANAAPAKCGLVCRVYLLLMRSALAPASDAPVIEGTPFN